MFIYIHEVVVALYKSGSIEKDSLASAKHNQRSGFEKKTILS